MGTEQDRQTSLSILSECLALTSSDGDRSKEPRLEHLLANFTENKLSASETLEVAAGWFFCLRPCFCAAIDIKQTPRKINGKIEMIWTQGSWFHFKKGDTLYDSPNAYLPWNLNNFRLCIDVTSGTPSRPANSKQRTERNPDSVIFNVLVPDATKTKLIKHTVKAMTQDDFVRMLILGPPDDWGFL